MADYFIKHHPPSHHIAVRPTILTPTNNPQYTKLFGKTDNAKHSKSSSKNAFTRHLLNTPAFKVMTATSA